MPDQEMLCTHCNTALSEVEFTEPYTVEECKLGPFAMTAGPPLCKPCWIQAYKERRGEEPTS